MRLLHLYWPHLPLRLARGRSSEPFPAAPIVLGGQPWTDGTVIDANRRALELGIRQGMPLGAAHRLAPEACFLDPDPRADARALETSVERLAAFSPGIAAATDVAATDFGRIEVQLDGLDRLWGPEPVVVARMIEALRPILPGAPLAGIAGTRFAAAAAARESRDQRPHIVEPEADREFLAPLPAALLSRDADVRARLERLGLRRIGEVARLPRSALVARFGTEGERLHARANAEDTEPFRPRRAPERLVLAVPIEPAVDDLAAVRFVLHRLAGAFGEQLDARGAAAGSAHLTLALDRSFAAKSVPRSITIEQRLPEPTSEGLAIERLLYTRLESSPPPAPVARLELELRDVAPAAGCQLTLFTPQSGRTARLGWQLARLALRFGPRSVAWVVVGDPEAPLPERRWTWRAVVDGLAEPETAPGPPQ